MRFRRPTHLVMVFEMEEDARRVYKVLPQRLARYGLTLHADKTRLIHFGRYRHGGDGPERGNSSFDFLGFTHYWGKSQKGKPVVKRKTASKRYRRGLKAVADWCRGHLHDPVREQHKQLCVKLRGHYSYYGITGNFRSLHRFKEETERTWRKWLNRRSLKRAMPWDRFSRLIQFLPLPSARIVHSVYSQNSQLSFCH